MLSTAGISVILGVLNEEENVQKLMDQFDSMIRTNHLDSINELVFVDDGSDDRTKEIIKENAESGHPYRIKLIERYTKLGMVNACIVGCQHASNNTAIIMDSDLQHPIDAIPMMIKQSKESTDMVIASRYMKGGCNSWSPIRGVISRAAVFLSHLLIKNSRGVKDPISGYFMTDVKYLKNLYPYKDSYKLAMYVLSANPSISVREIPFRMVDRQNGSSKIVDRNFSFLLNFLIELMIYWKVASRRSKIRKEDASVFADI